MASVSFPRFLLRLTVALGAATFLISAARAAGDLPGGPSYVTYSPDNVQSMQGDAPFTSGYQLTITSPSGTPAGTHTISMVSSVISAPAGSDPATAATFLSFSTGTLTFTGPGQSRTVTVTLTIPTGSATGDFSYKIQTSGWPAGYQIQDLGTTVNMKVLSSGVFPPPGVLIETPEENTIYVRAIGGAPVQVPISVFASAGESATLRTLVGVVSGVAQDGSLILPTPIVLATTGLGSATARGVGPYSAVKAGVYTFVATATNNFGVSTAQTTFTVREVPPPTVTITEPPLPSYTYSAGTTPPPVPFKFVGVSYEPGISRLTATLDGQPVTITESDLGTLRATGEGFLPATTAGAHQLVVTAEDAYGVAQASTSFTINFIRPTPAIVINDPDNNDTFTLPSNASTMDVPFTFTVTTTPGFEVDSISAKLGSATLAVPVQTGLGTEMAVGSGVMPALPVGTYTLTAYGVSAGVTVNTSVTFKIIKVSPPVSTPPTVEINTPPENSVYMLFPSGGCGDVDPLCIPLTFTGRSTSADAVITKLTAKLGSNTLSVTSTNLNTPTAKGAATMKVYAAGTYTIRVSATDKYGVAEATRTFVVKTATKQTVSGTVFFDVNFNGTKNTEDYGLKCVRVRLLSSSGQVVATDTTDSSGKYSFSVYPGSYIVDVNDVNGMTLTTLNDHPITVASSAVTVPATGYGLKFAALRGMCADGNSHGFWKNNIDKAIACKTSGVQVSAKAIKSYTTAIGSLALDPYKNLTMSEASAILSSNSSAATALLSKQLIASEYNYANGGFIGDDQALTYAFVYYGEYVLKNASSYSSSYITFVKDWMDAYNNSHGGKVLGPLP